MASRVSLSPRPARWAHRYELKSQLEQLLGEACPTPKIGQIYVTLQRIERDGLVQSQDVVQATRPNNRVYELTDADVDWLQRRREELILTGYGQRLLLRPNIVSRTSRVMASAFTPCALPEMALLGP
jgi:DNA-binding PadR family transcriptional regulator